VVVVVIVSAVQLVKLHLRVLLAFAKNNSTEAAQKLYQARE
jgi:hypothetical protein